VRVTFIVPPSGFLLDDRVFPALGVLKVAAALEAAGIDVRVLDLCGESDVTGLVRDHLAQWPSDVYGITATMPQMPVAASIAAQIYRAQHDAKLILGGPHVTLMNASARQEAKRGQVGRASKAIAELKERFDVLVCGDGEEAIFHALRPDAPDVVDADDPKSALFLSQSYLETAPFAARHLIDLTRYHYQIDGVRAQSLICQLGCPFGCNFCGGRRSPFLRKIRTRSTGQVIAEMRHLYETYGTHGFMFFDDELNVNTGFMGLLSEIERLQDEIGMAFRIRGFVKSELLTSDMAHAMYRAGFRQVLVGFESGSPRILQNIQKKATRDDNTKAVEALQRAGIRVKAAMSIGHPGESVETIQATREWLLQVQPDEFDVTIITVYPGTPYFDDAIEQQPGLWTYRDPRNGDALYAMHVDQLAHENFYKGVPGSYRSFVYTDHVSAEDLCVLRDDVEADVRARLAIPYPTAAAEVNFDHSMGQR
jgi:anaerobic magnesium-protoporphyrin IX monomethyl ester cyclase